MAKRARWLLPVAALLASAAYLLSAYAAHGLGFPLDDAWIYQSYARNLAQHGEWAFVHGTPSAGSTGPLWALLLAPGYWLRLAPFLWSYLLGVAILSALGWLVMRIVNLGGETRLWLPLLAGLGVLLEWHLVWAAMSGMETLLFCGFALAMVAALFWIEQEPGMRRWLAAGVLVGLAVWVRPEGVTLAGPFVAFALLQRRWRERGRALVAFLAGLAALFGPYLLFNRSLAGAWWPNTFFAKQVEYAVLVEQLSLGIRLARQFGQLLLGPGLLLVPGFILLLVRAVRARRWPVLLGIVWLCGHLTLYALRLPVTYQHGRYAMPAIALFVFFGWWGSLRALADIWQQAGRRLWAFGGGTALALITVGFLAIGAIAYARDVAVINTEMVAVAHWIADNLPEDALVAAHDIGALGYFAPREIVDLAGLVSPDVLPYMRDEAHLAGYLDQQDVDYVVTLQDWYDTLVADKHVIYQTDGSAITAQGGQNIAVYRWKNVP